MKLFTKVLFLFVILLGACSKRPLIVTPAGTESPEVSPTEVPKAPEPPSEPGPVIPTREELAQKFLDEFQAMTEHFCIEYQFIDEPIISRPLNEELPLGGVFWRFIESDVESGVPDLTYRLTYNIDQSFDIFRQPVDVVFEFLNRFESFNVDNPVELEMQKKAFALIEIHWHLVDYFKFKDKYANSEYIETHQGLFSRWKLGKVALYLGSANLLLKNMKDLGSFVAFMLDQNLVKKLSKVGPSYEKRYYKQFSVLLEKAKFWQGVLFQIPADILSLTDLEDINNAKNVFMYFVNYNISTLLKEIGQIENDLVNNYGVRFTKNEKDFAFDEDFYKEFLMTKVAPPVDQYKLNKTVHELIQLTEELIETYKEKVYLDPERNTRPVKPSEEERAISDDLKNKVKVMKAKLFDFENQP
jgi:hypothetical protein